MTFCPSCGAEQPDPPTAFCPSCGKAATVQPAAPAPDPPVEAPVKSPLKGRDFGRWWQGLAVWVRIAIVVAAAGLLIAAIVAPKNSGGGTTDPASKAQYQQFRAECEQVATNAVDGTIYAVGGNHWVDLVNQCLVNKASD